MKRETIKSYAVITFGCLCYALAFDWFLVPNAFTCGGFTGISQVINFFLPAVPIGVMTIVLNLPLFFIGFRRYGFSFLCKSLYTMAVSSVMIDVLNALHTFRPMDPMLACLYGGVLLGAGCGILFREETTTGGSELMSFLLKSRFEHLSVGRICMVIDMVVIITYAAVFRSLINALYGGVALYITTTVLDLMVYGGNAAKVAYIISARVDEITRQLLTHNVGVTKLSATGAYTNTDRPILLCAVRRREITRVKRLIKEIDPSAFLIMCDAREVLGEGFGEYKPDGL